MNKLNLKEKKSHKRKSGDRSRKKTSVQNNKHQLSNNVKKKSKDRELSKKRKFIDDSVRSTTSKKKNKTQTIAPPKKKKRAKIDESVKKVQSSNVVNKSSRVKKKKVSSSNYKKRKKKKKIKKKSKIKILIIFLVTLFILILIFGSFLGYYFNDKYTKQIIHNEDMAPYLVPDEEIIVEKDQDPKRFDIVAYHSAEDNDLTDVGRIIGVPGDTVEYLYNMLYINGRGYDESYLPSYLEEKVDSGSFSLIEVPGVTDEVIPPGYYLVLGDNRNDAEDSRKTGLVPQTHIIGVVRYKYDPLFHLEKIE